MITVGEFWTGVMFLNEAGSLWTLSMFMIFCAVGFLGMSCLAALTKAFGALTSAITATFRKGLTLLLSYILFPSDKAVTMGHVLGAGIFLGGLLIKALQRHDSPRIQPRSTVKGSSTERHSSSDSIVGSTVETVSNIWDELGRIHLPVARSPSGREFDKPFGVDDSLEPTLVNPSHPQHYTHVYVAGSVHCEDSGADGEGGLGIEVVVSDSDDGCNDASLRV